MSNDWAILLNGVYLTMGCEPRVFTEECDPIAVTIEGLDQPPEGLDLPARRTEMVEFAQRDGVKFYNQWYGPRDITLVGTIGPAQCSCDEVGDSCSCLTVRQQKRQLIEAWKRQCGTGCTNELVIFPPCETGTTCEERADTGPYGIVGMPMEALGRWLKHDEQIWEFTLRFTGQDQRIFILDECGTAGYANCEEITPGTVVTSICFTADPTDLDPDPEPTICFAGGGFCFPTEVDTGESVPPVEIEVCGTEKVYPTITLFPNLNKPTIENITTAEYVTFNGDVTDSPVVIDTYNGTAFQDGVSVTHLLSGNIFLSMDPGTYELRLISTSDKDDPDTGTAQLCWRPTVVTA